MIQVKKSLTRAMRVALGIPLIVAYGLGVDSTAVLVQLQRIGERPDLILFADTGNEKQETYDYLPIINAWLIQVGFPTVTVVRNVVKNFKHWPPYETLGENCLTNGTLPSLAFGFKSCSLKWKVAPQNRFCSQWEPALEAWARGAKCRKVIGYDNGTNDLKRYAQAIGVEDPHYEYWYPLIEWGWDRDRCKAEIAAAGLPVPPKSACYFCPATQAAELHEFKKEYLRYIVIMEARALPRLEGHIPQEELDRRYERALKKWEADCAAIKPGKKLPKKPRRGVQEKGVLGLWRRGTKGTGRGKAKAAFKPGMMTDYIRSAGLLPESEIDELIRIAPAEIISNQRAFANGFEIPSWHDFIEAFTPETGLEDVPAPRGLLPVLNDPCALCSGCDR